MKKVLLAIVAVLVIAIACLATFVSLQPSAFVITRSKTIAAPAEVIYPLIADLKQFPRWSPWQDLDPNMRATFGGPDMQVGQTYEWRGNSDVGLGQNDHGRAQVQ